MKILVTGATGFIGSGLCIRLVSNGHDVTGLVRSRTNQNFTVLQLDDLSLILPEHLKGFEVVVHTAGLAHQDDENPSLFNQINFLGTKTLANACVNAGVGHLIHLSSTKAVGEGSVGPGIIADPQSAYGKSKRKAEIQLDKIRNETDLKISTLRIPLVFGPGVKGHFPKLISLSALPIPLPYNALVARRSYLYIENLLDFIVYCLGEKEIANENFYIADLEMTSLGDILRFLREAQGKPALNLPLPVLMIPLFAKIFLPKKRFQQLFVDCETDISRTISLTDWKPKYTTKEGIDIMFRPEHMS